MLRNPFSLSLVLLLLPLMACSSSPKALEALQKQIQDEAAKQGANSIKRVICEAPKSTEETSILCTGLLESGSGFDIAVQRQDDQSYKWEILSIKGLLNMTQIQRSIQEGLKAEMGDVSLDCGGNSAYKMANPGDTLECQFKLEGKKAPPSTMAPEKNTARPETQGKVTITIMPSGDINWQRIVAATPEKSEKLPTGNPATKESRGKDGQATDSKTAADTKLQAPKESVPSAKDTNIPPAGEAAPAQSAEDAINQPGALDNIED